MTTSKPVPSRAAIHALRGLVFTTSCSVAILAEERRRRLKTVRAAAENARKIHAAKAHRGPAAVDGLAAWEARVLYRHDEVSTLDHVSPSPRDFRRPEASGGPQNHTRKRRTARQPYKKYTNDPLHIVASYNETEKPASTRQSRSDETSPLPQSKPQPLALRPRPAVHDDVTRSLRFAKSLNDKTHASIIKSSRQGNTRSSVHRARPVTNVQGNSESTQSKAHENQSNQRPTSVPAASPAPDGDALAAWIQKADEASRSQEEKAALHRQAIPLAKAGDGLAMWEVALNHVNTRTSAPGKQAMMSPHARAESASEEAMVASSSASRSFPHVEPQSEESADLIQRRMRTKMLLQDTKLFKPGYEPSKALVAIQELVEEQRLQVAPEDSPDFWTHMCSVNQRILDWYQAENDPSLSTALQLMLGFMNEAKADVPQASLTQQKNGALAFLQHVSAAEPSRLNGDLMLFLPDGDDWLGVLPDLVAWAVQHQYTDTLHQVMTTLRQARRPSLARETIAQALSKEVSPQELYNALDWTLLTQEGSSKPLLADLARLTIDAFAVVENDGFALDLLRKVEDLGIADDHGVLAQAVLIRDAPQLTSEILLARIRQLVQDPADFEWMQQWRPRIASRFIRSHGHVDNEAFLRGLHDIEPFEPALEWVEPILDQYGEIGDLDRFLDWLRFCVSSGCHLQSRLQKRLATSLAKQWTIPPNLLNRLQRDVGQLLANHKVASSTGQQCTASDVDGQLQGVKPTDVVYDELRLYTWKSDWTSVVETYQRHLDSGTSPTAACLGLAVSACLQEESLGILQAKMFVVEAHRRGVDIGEEMRRLLARELRYDPNPGERLAAAQEHGIAITTELYNIVVRRLLQAQDTEKALQLCRHWADEQGDGVSGFDMYNFACFLRGYVQDGSEQGLDALDELMSRFTAETRWWHRSAVCKETIKLCQKRLVDQAANPRMSLWGSSTRSAMLSRHQDALLALDRGLEHVAKQRAMSGNPGWIVNEVGSILNLPTFSRSRDRVSPSPNPSPGAAKPASQLDMPSARHTEAIEQTWRIDSTQKPEPPSRIASGREDHCAAATAAWQRTRPVLIKEGGHALPAAKRRPRQDRQGLQPADNVWSDLVMGRVEA
ncbi:hypothetical protein LIA77_07607 [Sarocladium implicatum]|nr:hypothetical protein LIA77_07607 [Sarocladium implicatum]